MSSPKLKEVIGENIFKRFYFINHNEYINLKFRKKEEENSCQLATVFLLYQYGKVNQESFLAFLIKIIQRYYIEV